MISAIIPFRDWSLERLERCVACLRDIAAVSEILIIDFGSVTPLVAPEGCRAVRVEADRWCLSEANNIGIAEAANDVVLKIDADVQLLIDTETLTGLADQVARAEVSFYVLQPTDFQYLNGRPGRKRLRPSWGEGCGNLFNRAHVVEIGGFDTRFFDYGGEDNDLCRRLRRYGRRVDIHQSDKVLHERHPPSEARVNGRFTEGHKKVLLADGSIFRPHPFRYSDYARPGLFGPAITVAIATTSRPSRDAHLRHCLSGLEAQSFGDFEVLICENGSPAAERLDEQTLRQAHPTLDIRLISLNEASIPKARNLITDHARGFYIAVHDDDDFSLPMRFEDQLTCLAEQDKPAHGCHSSWIEFDETTGQLKSYLGQRRDIDELHRRPGKITLHSTAFYRRDVLARVRYDESLTLGSDHQLQIRMLLTGLDIPHSGRFHALKRLHGASVTSTGTQTQRDVADHVNAAYKFFLGEPFLAAIRAQEPEPLWVTGFPTMQEMLTYLPDDFGAFHLDLDMEAALALGFDPIFEAGGAAQVEGMEFAPAFQGYGYDTRLVLRSAEPMNAGQALGKLPFFKGIAGVDIVSAPELANHPVPVSLEAIRAERGQRVVISRRFATMQAALEALSPQLLAAVQGQIGFFAVNAPDEAVHVLLGTFDTAADLEYALNIANAGADRDFLAVANRGRRGGFHGA